MRSERSAVQSLSAARDRVNAFLLSNFDACVYVIRADDSSDKGNMRPIREERERQIKLSLKLLMLIKFKSFKLLL